jgi:acetylornithine deacetylase/succinyl-diaminopimelate desuccinylase-like protein
MQRKIGYHQAKKFAAFIVLFSIPRLVFSAELAAVSWNGVEQEAVTLLTQYIQIDTTNPPGNEIKAAEFFKAIFDREGIEARIIESAPGRGNIYARLRGTGSKPAVVLMNHMDVVPADVRQWQEPPFGAVIRDGYLWGRGTLDMKGPAILQLMTVLALKRQNVRLQGDLIFLGTADEEAGGALGAGFLLETQPDLFQGVGLVLNEGGGIRIDENGKARFYSLGVAEKTPLWLKLTATGTAGHGSTPGGNSAVNKLLTALNRILHYHAPTKVVPHVQKYYFDSVPLEPSHLHRPYADLKAALRDPAFAAEFTKDPRANAAVRNTIAVTLIKASEKVNVIPAEALAEIDVRLLPGEDPKAFIEELRATIADSSIKIDVTLSFPPAISPEHPEALKAIKHLAKQHDGDVPVLAPLGRGFTDCHYFRERSIPCYGFVPMRASVRGDNLVHGIDERVSLDNLRFGVRMMHELVTQLVTDQNR